MKGLLTRALLQRAQQLLLTTDLRVKEVAASLGFQDEFYFTRFIKKHTGLPPSKYRRQFRDRA